MHTDPPCLECFCMSDIHAPDSNVQLCASGLIFSCKGHADQNDHVHISRLTLLVADATHSCCRQGFCRLLMSTMRRFEKLQCQGKTGVDPVSEYSRYSGADVMWAIIAWTNPSNLPVHVRLTENKCNLPWPPSYDLGSKQSHSPR